MVSNYCTKGGNAELVAAGEDPDLLGDPFFLSQFADEERGATVIAHQNVQTRMSQPPDGKTPAVEAALPTDTYVEFRRRKYHNGEPVEAFYQPNAITDGDSIVHFRRSDVIVAGDILEPFDIRSLI